MSIIPAENNNVKKCLLFRAEKNNVKKMSIIPGRKK